MTTDLGILGLGTGSCAGMDVDVLSLPTSRARHPGHKTCPTMAGKAAEELAGAYTICKRKMLDFAVTWSM